MNIKHLTVRGFKNIEEIDADITPTMNIFCGENANGKTNMIETIWLCSGCRSFRGTKDKDIVGFDKNSAFVELLFENKERENKISFTVDKNNPRDKKVFLNGVKKKNLSSLFGNFKCVIFTPEDLELSKGSPDNRRTFLDIAISQIKPVYVVSLQKYNDTLSQRNTLLKDIAFGSGDRDLLDIYDRQLAKHGSYITILRREYSALLYNYAGRIYKDMSRGLEALSLAYSSTVFKEDVENDMMEEYYFERLKAVRDDDIDSGFTTIGIHRDDLLLYVNNLLVREYGSQGQQRSTALSLKVAQAEILKEKSGDAPVILLDDALSEIDKRRQEFILNEIKDMQIILTCCDPLVAIQARMGNIYMIEKGRVASFTNNETYMQEGNNLNKNIDVSQIRNFKE
ncbi:MAG: DNA replication/repair protein RecF [Oscillospiraceae bacterium]